MSEWWQSPTILKDWPEDIENIMFIDESGHPSLKAIRRALNNNTPIDVGEKRLVVAGIVIERENYPIIRKKVLDIKNEFWSNAMYFYEKDQKLKRVCFHSEEIRKGQGPFRFSDIQTKENFILGVSSLMQEASYKILAAGLDKEKHVRKYTDPVHPYNLCMTFIIERFCQFFLEKRKVNGIIILESRGKREDKEILNYLVKLIKYGTRYMKSNICQRIKGIYFNPKWCTDSECKRSYFGNELADLITYPIHKYFRDGTKDLAFTTIEEKFDCYPNYLGRGFKSFP